jgi:hypothetical protein
MARRVKFTAITPAGVEVTRSSATMDYQYAIVTNTGALAWSQSYQNACKTQRARGGTVVPCTRSDR